MDAKEVNQRLRENVEAFCREFLSAGVERGGRWYVGSVSNEKGDSLVVELRGSKAGVWEDFANPGQGRAMLDLWMLVRGVDFKGAFRDACEWLGVNRTQGPLRRVTTGDLRRRVGESASGRMGESGRAGEPGSGRVGEAEIKVDWKPVEEGSRAWRYLVEERGIRAEVLERYRVGEGKVWFAECGKKVDAVVFPAYDPSGERVVMVKYMAIDRPEGKKVVRSNKAPVYHLIGMHAVGRDEKRLVICEGEIDMLSVASEGWPAVSVPFGAKAPGADGRDRGNRWIDEDWEWLESFFDVYLAFDMDEEGVRASEAVAKRIGYGRALCVEWPEGFKDANEVAREEPAWIGAALEGARGWDPEGLRRAGEFAEGVWEEFYPPDGEEPGRPCPWALPFRFGDGELTIWMGYNGHGKTVMQSFFMAFFGGLGRRVCIASLEIAAKKTLRNIWRQSMGLHKPMTQDKKPDREKFEKGMAWLDERFFIYDKVGEASLDDVLEVFRYAARRYGVTEFVVDSLLKMDVHEEDYEGQKGLTNKLVAFAREYGVHVHLVCHAKKPGEKRREDKYWPSKYDIKGSGALSDIAHNVVCVYRNKAKEATIIKMKNDNKPANEIDKVIVDSEDALFIVWKQREGGVEPVKRLWFDMRGSWQFMERFGEMPRCFVR